MARAKNTESTYRTPVSKRTSIGRGRLNMSSMNKSKRRSYKAYRGQGK